MGGFVITVHSIYDADGAVLTVPNYLLRTVDYYDRSMG